MQLDVLEEDPQQGLWELQESRLLDSRMQQSTIYWIRGCGNQLPTGFVDMGTEEKEVRPSEGYKSILCSIVKLGLTWCFWQMHW